MSDPQPSTQTRSPDVEALWDESEQLFAEHEALARELKQRGQARLAEMAAARERGQAAQTAEDQAWEAWSASRDACRADPQDLALTAAAEQAKAAYEAARVAANRAGREASELTNRLLADSTEETQRLLALGARARAAQDACFEAN